MSNRVSVYDCVTEARLLFLTTNPDTQRIACERVERMISDAIAEATKDGREYVVRQYPLYIDDDPDLREVSKYVSITLANYKNAQVGEFVHQNSISTSGTIEEPMQFEHIKRKWYGNVIECWFRAS